LVLQLGPERIAIATVAWALHMRAHTKRYQRAILLALTKDNGATPEPDSVRAQRLAELRQ